MPPETLVERLFEFLLEREGNTSILSRFDLPVIAQYLPEYERVAERLRAGRWADFSAAARARDGPHANARAVLGVG